MHTRMHNTLPEMPTQRLPCGCSSKALTHAVPCWFNPERNKSEASSDLRFMGMWATIGAATTRCTDCTQESGISPAVAPGLT
jgi:hypothetical protein